MAPTIAVNKCECGKEKKNNNFSLENIDTVGMHFECNMEQFKSFGAAIGPLWQF